MTEVEEPQWEEITEETISTLPQTHTLEGTGTRPSTKLLDQESDTTP